MKTIKPPMLRKGGTMGLVSPSGCPNSVNIQRAIHRFREMGFKVWTNDIVRRTTRWGYLAGTDRDRAESVNNAFRSSDVDAVFCTTGGYGAQRILPFLDYDAIRDNPKILVGYSDITALHHAIPSGRDSSPSTAPRPVAWAASSLNTRGSTSSGR